MITVDVPATLMPLTAVAAILVLAWLDRGPQPPGMHRQNRLDDD